MKREQLGLRDHRVRWEQQVHREQPAHKAPRAQKVQGARPVLRVHKAQLALRARLVRREPSHRQQLLTMPPAQKTL